MSEVAIFKSNLMMVILEGLMVIASMYIQYLIIGLFYCKVCLLISFKSA